jgi:hypothetical protein
VEQAEKSDRPDPARPRGKTHSPDDHEVSDAITGVSSVCRVASFMIGPAIDVQMPASIFGRSQADNRITVGD